MAYCCPLLFIVQVFVMLIFSCVVKFCADGPSVFFILVHLSGQSINSFSSCSQVSEHFPPLKTVSLALNLCLTVSMPPRSHLPSDCFPVRNSSAHSARVLTWISQLNLSFYSLKCIFLSPLCSLLHVRPPFPFIFPCALPHFFCLLVYDFGVF